MSVPKLFTDDTSLFSAVHHHKTTVLSLNENLLKKVSGLMNGTCCLIQIPRSKLKKLCFLVKNYDYSRNYFPKQLANSQEYTKLRSLLDVKLIFLAHINEKTKKEQCTNQLLGLV